MLKLLFLTILESRLKSQTVLARIFHENAQASAVPESRFSSGKRVSERTAIKWYKYLTFRIPLQRDCSTLQGSSIAVARPRRWACHAQRRRLRRVPGGRRCGHIIRARCAPLSPASGFPVSRSQQVIHEISGLGYCSSASGQLSRIPLYEASQICIVRRWKGENAPPGSYSNNEANL